MSPLFEHRIQISRIAKSQLLHKFTQSSLLTLFKALQRENVQSQEKKTDNFEQRVNGKEKENTQKGNDETGKMEKKQNCKGAQADCMFAQGVKAPCNIAWNLKRYKEETTKWFFQ